MTLEEFAAAVLERPDSWADMSGEDKMYVTHGRTIARSRDSDVLGISNWEVISKDMLERFPYDVFVAGSSHWVVGWVDELFVRVYTGVVDEDAAPGWISGPYTEAIQEMYDWHCKLQDYPVADESDLSERESEDARKTLVACYDVPEALADTVARFLWDEHDIARSEEFTDTAVYEAMTASGIAPEDIPSWMHPKPGESDTEAPRGYLEGASNIHMSTMDMHGNVTETKIVDANICPHLILVADHYNDDGPCKCYDESALEMMTMGYRFKDGMWR